jgi:lipopolysaccharide export system permease protein
MGFIFTSAILIILIWFSRAIGFVKYVTENGVELSQFFSLFVLILPWLLLFIVPIALFGTVLLIYNRLIIDNEITILKNSGLTKIAIARPAIFLSIILSAFSFIIAFYLMPYANKELRLSRRNIQDNYTNLSFNAQTFESLKDLTIYAKNRDENDQLFGILLHDERSAEYSITITAKTGKIAIEDKSALLYMKEGTLQKSNHAVQKTEILNFDDYVFNLSENQKGETAMRWKAKERYLPELTNPESDADEHELASFRSEIHQRFTYPLLPIVLTMIACACVLQGQFQRRGNASNLVMAVGLMVTFLGINLMTYNLLESSLKFAVLLYGNIALFLFISFRILTGNYRSKK